MKMIFVINNRVFVLIVTLLLFLVFPVLVFAKTEYIVNIDDKQGFVPDRLNINVGDEVKFVNIGTKGHWPASNIHPAHLIYSDFDPKKPIAPKDSWSFVFKRPGSWGMHDHLFPQFKGVINVAGEGHTETNHEKLSVFDELKIRILNWIPYFKKIYLTRLNLLDVANKKDQKQMRFIVHLMDVKSLSEKFIYDSDGERRDCHQQAHYFGRVYFEEFGAEFLRNMDLGCHSGFLHGAMEAYLSENKLDTFINKAQKQCVSYPSKYEVFTCMHGMGHGIMAATDFSLPIALKYCDRVSDRVFRKNCYGGVFMENVASGLGTSINQHSTEWLSADPKFPCNHLKLSSDEQVQCYDLQVSWLTHLFHGNFLKITETCEQLVYPEREGCFTGIGRQAAIGRDTEEILKKCKPSINKQQDYKACLVGGLMVIVHYRPDRLKDEPQRFCDKVSESYKDYCYEKFFSRLRDIFVNNEGKIRELCFLSGPKYDDKCKSITHLI